MIIDCHTHLGRNDHINYSVEDLLTSMDNAGIDKALVFAGEIADCPNEWMLEQIAPHTDRLYGVAAAHPLNPKFKKMSEVQNDAVKLARWYAQGKIKAVKFYTGYDHYYPFDMKDNDDYLMELADVGCPVIFHSGDCLASCKHAKLKYAHPLHIDEVAVDFPETKFIIAHMGFPWHRDAAEVCYKNPNVYADISGFVYGDFKHDEPWKFKKVISEFLDIAPVDKLLFGTDAPISNQKSYLNALWDAWGDTLTPKRLSDNVKKVFKI